MAAQSSVSAVNLRKQGIFAAKKYLSMEIVWKVILKSIHFRNSVFSLCENKVLQVMPAGTSFERFGQKDFVFIK